MKSFRSISLSTFFPLLFLPMLLFGQEKDPDGKGKEIPKPATHELGAAFGLTTGWGLSYRIWPSRFGFQGTAYYSKRNEGEFSNVTRSTGLTFLYKLHEGNVVDLFLYQGNHLLLRRYPAYPPNCAVPSSCNQEMTSERWLSNGLGFGMRFMITDRIDFSLMTGYAVSTEDPFEGHSSSTLQITGETGLYYRF